jgi:methylglyoxal synthase
MNIALVAHDSRKKELVEWVKYNLNELKKHNLFATGTTGKLIKEIPELWVAKDYTPPVHGERYYEERSGTYEVPHGYEYPLADKVTCLHSGPLGGDAEIGAKIANGEIDVLIFFCDNLIQQGHQNDIYGLTRLASLYNIAFATNRTTADMILTSPLLKDWGDGTYKPIIPAAIDKYKNRFNDNI